MKNITQKILIKTKLGSDDFGILVKSFGETKVGVKDWEPFLKKVVEMNVAK